jgi:hypothetical protein
MILLRAASAGHQVLAAGGLSVPAALYAFWEPLFAWGVILSLLVLYQRRFVVLGPLWRDLSRRAYLIYIIHLAILVGVSRVMRGLAAPALVKFLLAGWLPARCVSWLPERCCRSPPSAASSDPSEIE